MLSWIFGYCWQSAEHFSKLLFQCVGSELKLISHSCFVRVFETFINMMVFCYSWPRRSQGLILLQGSITLHLKYINIIAAIQRRECTPSRFYKLSRLLQQYLITEISSYLHEQKPQGSVFLTGSPRAYHLSTVFQGLSMCLRQMESLKSEHDSAVAGNRILRAQHAYVTIRLNLEFNMPIWWLGRECGMSRTQHRQIIVIFAIEYCHQQLNMSLRYKEMDCRELNTLLP